MTGLAWLFMDKVGILLLSTLSTFWYAKLLGPEGFGQAAIILAIYQIAAKALGVVQQSPLVALKGDVRQGYNVSATGWLFVSLIVSFVTLMAIGWAWGEDAVLYSLFPCAALAVVSLSKVYLADLLRAQNFRSLAYRQTLSRLISVVAGLMLAYFQYPMWAVIVQWSLEPFISYVILRRQSSFVLKYSFDRIIFLQQLRQGGPLLIKSISQEMKGKGLIVLLGVFVSEVASAYYSLAIKFVDLIRTFFSYSFSSFALPRFVEVREDVERLAQRYESLSVLLVTLMVPVCFGVASLSVMIVSVFFSPEWYPVADAIYWLCIIEAVVSVVSLVQPLQVATFNAKNTVLIDSASFLVVPLIFVLSYQYLGIDAAIVACAVHAVMLIPFYTRSMYRIVKPRVIALYSSMFFVVLSGLIMNVVLSLMDVDFGILGFLSVIVAGGVCYLASYFIFLMVNLINSGFLKKERFV